MNNETQGLIEEIATWTGRPVEDVRSRMEDLLWRGSRGSMRQLGVDVTPNGTRNRWLREVFLVAAVGGALGPRSLQYLAVLQSRGD